MVPLFAQENLPKDFDAMLQRYTTLWSACEVGEETEVNIELETKHSTAVVALATLLPPDASGFMPAGSPLNLTAGEALTHVGKKIRADFSFRGQLPPELVTPLIQRMQQLAPEARPRTRLQLNAKGVRWKAAAADTHAGFGLMDRGRRFLLFAHYTPARTSGTKALKEERAAVEQATGLKFKKIPGAGAVPQQAKLTSEQAANACVVFDHCVEVISQSLRREKFDWRGLTGVFENGYGVSRRFEAAFAGPAEAFRWEPRLNQLMREAFPQFRRKAAVFSDAHTFLAPLEGGWHLALVYDTHEGRRVGRVFKLRCGVVFVADNSVEFMRNAPVLRCSGGLYMAPHDWCPEFSFNTSDELEALFASLETFLPPFFARFEAILRATFLPGVADLAAALPPTRAVTARDAQQLARQFLLEEGFAEPNLTHAELSVTSNRISHREPSGPPVPRDGRSDLHHQWVLTYATTTGSLRVTVPYAGLISHGRFAGTSEDRNPTPPAPQLHDGWSDSNTAIDWFQAALETFRSRYPDMNGVLGPPALRVFADRDAWIGQIEFKGETGPNRGWVLILHGVDARTGERISTTFDERFDEREPTRETLPEGAPPAPFF